MSAVGRLCRAECWRLAASRRWLFLGTAILVAAYLAAADVATEANVVQLVPSVLDVHAALTNNLMYVGYLVFVAFAFLTGDLVSADRARGYAALVHARASGRARWWLAKVGATGATALAVQVMLVVACALVGRFLHGWTMTVTPSSFAAAPAGVHAMLLFPTRSAAGEDALSRQLQVAVYVALAFWVFALALMLVSVRWPGIPPAGVALIVLMADYVCVKAFDPWSAASLGARLLEGASVTAAGSLLPSAALLAAAGGLITGVGLVVAWRVEL